MPSRRRQIPNNTNTNIIPKPKEEEDQQQLHQNRNNYNDDNSSREMHHDPEDGSCISSMDTVAHEATTIPPNEIDHQPDDEQTSQSLSNAHNTLGSKPKLSNMSLLSSAVAYATLERCLLGLNGGEETTTAVDQVVETPIDDHCNASSSSTSSPSPAPVSSNNINYSKQCKSGHIIDILELRRLSSRGVPDEPPENRIAHDNTTAPLSSTTTTMGLGRKSYRPLVWRVLLGYLPPQTSLWNMVLDRDRKLYDMLVQELFSSTCPAPHEYYVHEKKEEEEILTRERGGINSSGNLEKEGQNDNGKQKGITNDGKEFVIDDDDDGQEDIIAEINDNAAPGTPNEFTADETTSTTATTTTAAVTTPIATPLTPGLLSEWIRGENGGENAVFGTPSQLSSSSSSKSNNNLARISPMCAMNTPRTRTYNTTMKKAVTVRTITEDIAADLADIEQTSSLAMLEESSGDVVDGVLSHRLKESLLLPYQGDDDEEEEEEEEEEGNAIMDTINIVDSSEGESSGAEQSIPQTKPSSEDEATQGDMKMHRHGSSGDDSADDDAFAILPTTTPNSSSTVPPDNDEEENMILLDEIRKDVIRTHPDLRFFLEPEDGLGQKRYAALERILFVWAKLNKGVRQFIATT